MSNRWLEGTGDPRDDIRESLRGVADGVRRARPGAARDRRRGGARPRGGARLLRTDRALRDGYHGCASWLTCAAGRVGRLDAAPDRRRARVDERALPADDARPPPQGAARNGRQHARDHLDPHALHKRYVVHTHVTRPLPRLRGGRHRGSCRYPNPRTGGCGAGGPCSAAAWGGQSRAVACPWSHGKVDQTPNPNEATTSAPSRAYIRWATNAYCAMRDTWQRYWRRVTARC